MSVFFLISGFLLYRPFAVSHLTGRPGPNVRRFWQRRLLRIVPAYWVALTLLAYVFHWVTMGPGWQGVVSQYLFLQIYLPNQIFFGITQAWSLCTEMSFYLFLPLYATADRLRRRRSVTSQLVRELIGLAVLLRHQLRVPVLGAAPAHPHRDGTASWSPCAHRTAPPSDPGRRSWSIGCPPYLDLFALGHVPGRGERVVGRAPTRSRPGCSRGSFPGSAGRLAGAAFCGVAHVMTDHEIFYLVMPRVNLEKQALYGAVAFFLLVPAVFGPQDSSLDPPLPSGLAGGQRRGDLLRHLSLAPESHHRVPGLGRLAQDPGAVLAPGLGRASVWR